MIHIHKVALAAATATLLASSAKADERFSMTGTYEGGFACDDVTGGSPGSYFSPAVLEIVQSGSHRIDLALTYDDLEGPETTLYRGEIAFDPAGDTVSGFFESCGGTFESSELTRIFPAAADDAAFAFAGDTIFVSTDSPGLEGQLITEACKYAFTRVDHDRPDIDTCD